MSVIKNGKDQGGIAVIYITGDSHCPIDIGKLGSKHFDDSEMTKDDCVIICGDAGFTWFGRDSEDSYWQKWLHGKNFTTLFVDGNHENHDKLDSYPIEIWNGGKVHKLNDSVIHLMRGQVYTIDGHKIFTMGGATSTDKEYRKEGKSWWSRELPSNEEYDEAFANLEAHNWQIDYVVTHTAPDNIMHRLASWYGHDKLTNFLFVVDKQLEFKRWYFGHFHDDRIVDDEHHLLYSSIVPIERGLVSEG